MKKCRGCGIEKPLEAFHRCKKVADGRKARCADCMNAENRQWRRDNPEKHDAAVRAWREQNSERYAASRARWEAANPGRRRSISVDPVDKARRLAEWKAANRDRVREYQRRRRAAGYGLPADSLDLDALWRESQGACGICGEAIDRALRWPHPASASIDHILPLSKGGAHSQENAQWAHLRCNLRKGDRLAV